MTTVTHYSVPVCIADSCRRDGRPDHPRTTTTTARPPPPSSRHSTRFQRLRPSTTPTSGFPFDVLHEPEEPDYGDLDSDEQQIRFSADDDDDEDDAFESSGSRPFRTRPGRGGRPQTGSPSLTGSSILRDDVAVDRRPKVFPAPPPDKTTSGGRGHQRHVVSVTASSASGSGAVRLPVVTSFLACAVLALTACFHHVGC